MKSKPRLALLSRSSLLAIGVLAMAPAAAQAASNFDPSPGSYTIDTTTLTLTGPGTNITGSDVNGTAVFSFGDVSIPAGATITASGSRPLEITATGTFDLSGTIDGSGTSATTDGGVANPGGPGGGQGSIATVAGSGPGGGSPGSTATDGGGGGGFGGAGAAGGSDVGTGGAGGPAYGDLNVALQGGSGGAEGTLGDTGGGGGGGGIELSATSLTISATGSVLANGGDGNGAGNGASGGGSGGGILLHANSIDVSGTVSANGGQGGTGGCCGDGGGGGGGRVAYQYVTLVAAGSPTVAGGTSGTSGPYGFGEQSPEVAGANGVITMAQAASASTGSATSITGTSATVHGTVNPHGQPATYQFQYGTSTSYGKTAPASAASAGSGSSPVSVSASLKGLKRGKTYHYRIVVHSLGFTITGADRTFKTRGSRPHVSTGRASGVSSTRARVSGSVNAEGTRTTYYFQYHSAKGATRSTRARSAGSGSRALNHSALLSGLSPSTTYHYRIVARNAFGTARGSWRTFKTRRAAAPAFTG